MPFAFLYTLAAVRAVGEVPDASNQRLREELGVRDLVDAKNASHMGLSESVLYIDLYKFILSIYSICIYVYVYIYIYIHTHAFTQLCKKPQNNYN